MVDSPGLFIQYELFDDIKPSYRNTFYYLITKKRGV